MNGAFPLPPIGDRAGRIDAVLEEEDEEEEEESTEESTEESSEEGTSGPDESSGDERSPRRSMPRRSMDPNALEAVIADAVGPNPAVSRTPSPWLLDNMDSQDRFDTEHRTCCPASAHSAGPPLWDKKESNPCVRCCAALETALARPSAIVPSS